jgi:ABC-type transporter Mla MlaB component
MSWVVDDQPKGRAGSRATAKEGVMSQAQGGTVSFGEHRLDVHHSRTDNSQVIVCHGWLDSETCEGLQELIDALVEERIERLRLDLTDLLGIDESGRRCLGTTSRRCATYGVLLEIDAPRSIAST